MPGNSSSGRTPETGDPAGAPGKSAPAGARPAGATWRSAGSSAHARSRYSWRADGARSNASSKTARMRRCRSAASLIGGSSLRGPADVNRTISNAAAGALLLAAAAPPRQPKPPRAGHKKTGSHRARAGQDDCEAPLPPDDGEEPTAPAGIRIAGPAYSPQREHARMVVEINGVELNYETAGEGEPLCGCTGSWARVQTGSTSSRSRPRVSADRAGSTRTRRVDQSSGGFHSGRPHDVDAACFVISGWTRSRRSASVAAGSPCFTWRQPSTCIESMAIVSAPPYFPEQARALQRQTSESMFGEVEMDLMRKRHQMGTPDSTLFAHSRALADSYDDVNFTPPISRRSPLTR